MKLCRQLLFLLFTMLLLLSGCGKSYVGIPSTTDSAYSDEELMENVSSELLISDEKITDSENRQAGDVKSNDIAGVSIDFDYTRMPGKASNQIALWIENGTGEMIKTLLVTDFTARRRGFENREDALDHWVDMAEPENMSDEEIDAVSSATPQTGTQHYSWDLTDGNGQRVSDGRYYIRLEGTLYWSSNVLYTGKIDLKDTVSGDLEIKAEQSEPDNTDNETMLQNVRMNAMTENKNAVDNTAEWLGGLEPQKALEYMKEHYDEGLVIVEVNTDYWKLETGFMGAMHIPHDQMAERYDEIPSDVPVILHCGAGVVSVPAYETLMEKRKDISENCTWGQRKRFADGKVTVPFGRFLGYDRGPNGELLINEEQAEIVRKIYGYFLQGRSPYQIAKLLAEQEVPTPSGKGKWCGATVKSILTNEKYKGDALLQKSITVDFLTKKIKANEGDVPQYYVEGDREAIIQLEIFDRVQILMEARSGGRNRSSSVNVLSGKIKCGDCGSWYGSKVWHSNDKYRRVIWQCNHKFDGGEKCSTPHLDEETIKQLFIKALNMSGPTKDFYRLLMEGQIIHGGHPVLRWMAGNVVVDTDPAGNIKVTKAKSKEKIDGIVVGIMALDRCIRNQTEPQRSVYDDRGLLIL